MGVKTCQAGFGMVKRFQVGCTISVNFARNTVIVPDFSKNILNFILTFIKVFFLTFSNL